MLPIFFRFDDFKFKSNPTNRLADNWFNVSFLVAFEIWEIGIRLSLNHKFISTPRTVLKKWSKWLNWAKIDFSIIDFKTRTDRLHYSPCWWKFPSCTKKVGKWTRIPESQRGKRGVVLVFLRLLSKNLKRSYEKALFLFFAPLFYFQFLQDPVALRPEIAIRTSRNCEGL